MANATTSAIIDHLQSCIRENRHGLGLDPYQVAGPASASALKPDKTYTSVKLFDGQEIMLTGIRSAKRQNYVFEFAPVDTQPWTQVEFQDNTVFDFVKGLEESLVKALGAKPDSTFLEASAFFARNAEKIRQQAEADRKAKIAAAEKEADAVYETNPNFGMF